MDIYEALYTTRAMRRVRTDSIPQDVQARILDAAIRAPSGGNSQGWRFLLVDDPEQKAKLGPLYRSCFAKLTETIYADAIKQADANPDAPETQQFRKMTSSAGYLAEHFEDYPLILFAFTRGDPQGSSIYPAVWSAMLAARAEGVGSTLTSVMAFELDQLFEILGVPRDKNWIFSACVPMGYPTGRWGVAPRTPAHEVAYRNRWGDELGLEISAPLWKGSA